MLFSYFLPTRIVFGNGSIANLPEHLTATFPQAKKIFLVTGRRSFRQTGLYDKVIKLLESYDVYIFDNVESSPTSHTLDQAMAEYKKVSADIIIAIGGGSVMDLGKAVAILAHNTGKLADYQMGAKPIHEGVPFIAIPSTIGTAAEMISYAILINAEGPYVGKLKSFSDPKMYPQLAVIDPELALSIPAKETMGTALDIISASVESMWSRKRNPLSTVYAQAALKTAFSSIPKVMDNDANPEAREELALACLYSGFAVSNSRTGMNHKVSYPLTARYHLHHGAACALMLPYFLEYFGKREVPDINVAVEALGATTYQEAAEKIRSLVAQCHMPTRLSEIGVDEHSVDYLVHEAWIPPAQQDDPITISREDLHEILRTAL